MCTSPGKVIVDYNRSKPHQTPWSSVFTQDQTEVHFCMFEPWFCDVKVVAPACSLILLCYSGRKGSLWAAAFCSYWLSTGTRLRTALHSRTISCPGMKEDIFKWTRGDSYPFLHLWEREESHSMCSKFR